MNEFLIKSLVTLFVIIDPIAVVPAFLGITRGDPEDVKKHIARKACIISFFLLISFALLGDKLLDVMNISEPAFRIAGGILLMISAIEMVIGKHKSTTDEEDKEASGRSDVSVFPLAIPLISGPGALTSVVIIMRQAETMGFHIEMLVLLLLMIVVSVVYICLRWSTFLMKILGVTGTNVLTRVFGIILAAVAVQAVINGIQRLI
jgi:multiple antibiotic resistance protein